MPTSDPAGRAKRIARFSTSPRISSRKREVCVWAESVGAEPVMIPMQYGALTVEVMDGATLLVTVIEGVVNSSGRLVLDGDEWAMADPFTLVTRTPPPGWDWTVGTWDAATWMDQQRDMA